MTTIRSLCNRFPKDRLMRYLDTLSEEKLHQLVKNSQINLQHPLSCLTREELIKVFDLSMEEHDKFLMKTHFRIRKFATHVRPNEFSAPNEYFLSYEEASKFPDPTFALMVAFQSIDPSKRESIKEFILAQE